MAIRKREDGQFLTIDKEMINLYNYKHKLNIFYVFYTKDKKGVEMKKIEFKKEGSKSHGSAGITLIALVVTIIILIILAGVLINIVLGNRGLFALAKKGAKLYSDEQIREQIKLAYHSALTTGLGKVNEKDLEDAMKVEFKDKLDKDGNLPSNWLTKPSPEDNNKWRITIDGVYLDVPAGISTPVDEKSIGLWINDSKISDYSPQDLMNVILYKLWYQASGGDYIVEHNQNAENDILNIIFEKTGRRKANVIVELKDNIKINTGVSVLVNLETGDSSIFTPSDEYPPSTGARWEENPNLSEGYLELDNTILENPLVRYNGNSIEKELHKMLDDTLKQMDTDAIVYLIGD